MYENCLEDRKCSLSKSYHHDSYHHLTLLTLSSKGAMPCLGLPYSPFPRNQDPHIHPLRVLPPPGLARDNRWLTPALFSFLSQQSLLVQPSHHAPPPSSCPYSNPDCMGKTSRLFCAWPNPFAAQRTWARCREEHEDKRGPCAPSGSLPISKNCVFFMILPLNPGTKYQFYGCCHRYCCYRFCSYLNACQTQVVNWYLLEFHYGPLSSHGSVMKRQSIS